MLINLLLLLSDGSMAGRCKVEARWGVEIGIYGERCIQGCMNQTSVRTFPGENREPIGMRIYFSWRLADKGSFKYYVTLKYL